MRNDTKDVSERNYVRMRKSDGRAFRTPVWVVISDGGQGIFDVVWFEIALSI